MRPSLPILGGESERPSAAKPSWLKVRAPGGPRYAAMKTRARRLSLATVCEEARCPNLGECWSGGTATFMLMGEVCTRGCRFCAVETKRQPPALDLAEPEHIAEAVAELGLSYVVITSVNRDDLADGGAAHLASCMRAIRAKSPAVRIELLIPDFEGKHESVATVAETDLAVLAHNVETVERLTPGVRDPRARYRRSLAVLDHAKSLRPALLTKSSIMLGLGETEDEVLATLRDLKGVGVDIVTLGQYLRPSFKHLPVAEYVTPDRFERLGAAARALGFGFVASGPLVRSSYRAGELYVEGRLANEPLREHG
ncbi:MAG: lipoyl synthase [Deltaproteobacteria bacterium]|nr:lipoyl synthase [Deltaproteobacteria bacterium]